MPPLPPEVGVPDHCSREVRGSTRLCPMWPRPRGGERAPCPLPTTTAAQPQLLSVTPRVYHSADCHHDWNIETTEANQATAYWRAS